MAGPEFILRSYNGGAFPCQLVAPMLDADLTFTLSGPFANWPTGAEGPGPFTLAMDDGLPTVEKILCSALNISTGLVNVYVDGDFTGRGYDGTSPNAHTPQAAPNPQVRPCWTAEEAMEANITATTVMGGAATAGNGYVLTAEAGTATWQAPGGSVGGLVPIGSVTMFAGAAAPTGFHICDGSAVSRTGATAALFAAIGTTWGVGDGTTTFNLPDLRDRFAIGTQTHALGNTGGSTTISIGNLPAHNHPGSTVAITDPTHTHLTVDGISLVTATAGHSTIFSNSGSDVDHGPAWNFGNSSLVSEPTGITASPTIANQGSGDAYLQPYASLNYIIRTT